jgi:AcrR family transcriptional regulator
VVANAIDKPGTARSRRTRAALLDAARELIESGGFGALTMAAVAERAGITRRGVYLHFASRTEIVGALFDHVREAEGLGASLQPVWDAPDARTALDEWAAHLARYNLRILAVDRATTAAAGVDPDASHHLARVATDQRSTAARLAARLADEGVLAAPWTVASAADMLWALMSPGAFGLLVERCDWRPAVYAERLATLLRRTFLAPDEPADVTPG